MRCPRSRRAARCGSTCSRPPRPGVDERRGEPEPLEEPSSGGRSLRSQGGGPLTSVASLSASHALRVWDHLLAPRRAAQWLRSFHPALSGKRAAAMQEGAPEAAWKEDDAEGAARRALLRWPKPPVSGRRASHFDGLALCVSDLRVCGHHLATDPGMQAAPAEETATSGEIAGRDARTVSRT